MSYTEFAGNVFLPVFWSGNAIDVGIGEQINPIDLPVLESLVFHQTVASSSWEFAHNFGVAPFVVVYDQNGTNITNNLVISCDKNIVRVNANNNLITGRVEVYHLGVGATQSNALTRTTQTFTINQDIPINGNYATSIQLAKTYQLLVFECNTPIRLRIYNSQASQTADLIRAISIFPGNDSGLIFEGISTLNETVINLSPVPTGYTLDGSINAFATITNLSSASLNSLLFNLTYLPLE